MKNQLNDNIIQVMASVAYLKHKAKEAGLIASYIPVVGAIELTDLSGIQLGISFDGKRVKVGQKYHKFEKYIQSFKMADKMLGLFKPFSHEKVQQVN